MATLNSLKFTLQPPQAYIYANYSSALDKKSELGIYYLCNHQAKKLFKKVKLVIQKGFFARTTVGTIDILWTYIQTLGSKTIEKSSIFGISKWSLQKAVGTERVK